MTKRSEDQAQHRSPLAFIPEQEIDVLFGYSSPNPAGDGCPSYDVLIALSRRERPISDPAYEHLAACSPCYREVRKLQQESSEQPRNSLKRFRELWWWRRRA